MKRIVVGLDTSERAPEVLNRALEMARGQGAKLIVVRAVGLPIGLPIEELTVSPEGLPAKLLAATQAGLDRQLANAPKDLIERAEARIGTPWQVICDAAKEFGADLIVIGTHGHGPLDRMIGTTAARVVNHAPCSVLVVRPTQAH